MPIKYIIEYENGVEVNRIPFEISDSEVEVSQVETETKKANDNALLAYRNYDNLTLAQKDRILKGLLGDFIHRNRENYIGE